MTETSTIDIAADAAKLRPVLYRLALLQLRDAASADDAVQETLLDAIEGSSGFKGRASVKTWLISILRYKVLDALRSQSLQMRVAIVERSPDDELDASAFDPLFDDAGCWSDPKDVWTDPQAAAEQQAFFKVLEACLKRLPPRTSRAFLMREWLELDTSEICADLGVNAGNLRILLWRARMQLRACLDVTWDRTP
jgi:RNA polymerase sigma-70 factor (ECF subfamily)